MPTIAWDWSHGPRTSACRSGHRRHTYGEGRAGAIRDDHGSLAAHLERGRKVDHHIHAFAWRNGHLFEWHFHRIVDKAQS
jgi:hypothetical protein